MAAGYFYPARFLTSLANGGQDDDVKLLCLALEENSSLTSLDLRMNDISSDLVELEMIEVVFVPE